MVSQQKTPINIVYLIYFQLMANTIAHKDHRKISKTSKGSFLGLVLYLMIQSLSGKAVIFKTHISSVSGYIEPIKHSFSQNQTFLSVSKPSKETFLVLDRCMNIQSKTANIFISIIYYSTFEDDITDMRGLSPLS